MKLSRDQLKALVRECLIELLEDGLGSVERGSVRAESRVAPCRSTTPRQQQRRQPPVHPGLDEVIKRGTAGNAVLESILTDTAATTLRDQGAHGDVSGGQVTPSQREQFNGTPEEVFGEDVAARWASLAFVDDPKKSA